jgi:hypothetical protein
MESAQLPWVSRPATISTHGVIIAAMRSSRCLMRGIGILAQGKTSLQNFRCCSLLDQQGISQINTHGWGDGKQLCLGQLRLDLS